MRDAVACTSTRRRRGAGVGAAAGLAERAVLLRADFVHAHQVTALALGRLANHKADSGEQGRLDKDDRGAGEGVEGRCCLAGKMVINQAAIQLTENVLRAKCMPLSVAGRQSGGEAAFGRETG